MEVRSSRNKNPGNLRVGQPWLGLCPVDQMTPGQIKEHDFCVFKSADFGFRALAMTLLTYFRRYKLKSVYSIISRFAPANENDTKAYVNAVASHLGVAPNVLINVEDYSILQELCRAISIHEAGGWVFDNSDLDAGVKMALGIMATPTDPNSGPLSA